MCINSDTYIHSVTCASIQTRTFICDQSYHRWLTSFPCLQLIPAISSLTPVTTALPLAFVLAVTGIKDSYDDYVRTYVVM